MSSRRRTLAVIVAAFIGGLCFGPVFSVAGLLPSVGAVCLAAYLVTELCRLWPSLLAWRPILVIAAGLLAVIETVLRATTLAGLPTGSTFSALGHGLSSWQTTLESTWPARPDAELVLFVPLLVLLACLLGLELLDRTPPLVAVLPGLAVVGVSQLYIALAGLTAVLVALAYGLVVAALLVADWTGRTDKARRTSPLSPLVAAAIVMVIAVVGGVAVSALDVSGRTPYTLQKAQSAAVPNSRVASPLDELASRLSQQNQGKLLFRYKSSEPVSRWRQVALEQFDGANWSTDYSFLRLGSQLAPGPRVTVGTTEQHATVELKGLTGPWLPGQLLPSSVSGVEEPQIEPNGGTLISAVQPQSYDLTWSKPAVSAKQLYRSGIDPDEVDGLGNLGPVPNEIYAKAEEAIQEKRATFATALALETYMWDHYQVATKDPLPTGHSWPQLKPFLEGETYGTSEQFAAGYVALARLKGIPARLAVGFRAPDKPDADGWYSVYNRDAFAWPEVAVDGVGWWPLDPAGKAAEGNKKPAPGSDAEVTQQAREESVPVDKIEDPVVPPSTDDPGDDRSWGGVDVPVFGIFIGSVALLLLWLVGVPLLKLVRGIRRRRRTGSAAVVGAWAEVRDRLRAHGVAVTTGMTVRDLVAASGDVADDRARAGIGVVAQSVDRALWSGAPAGPDLGKQAWDGVREVSRGLRSRPWTDRLQAAFEIRSLF
ncbi:DUF3488 and transglutaminase-like domain-containing protein [Kribbella sp. NBC_00382]|uniref:transglutaminase family protein n=1 Tax=Kribbella sp. NBC_00382 TaxID=2975967 RepID=UPI002E2061CF